MSAPFLILVALFVALTLARVPIAFAMLVAAFGYLFAAGHDIGLAADQIMNTLANNYLLVAIPLFMLAANLMNAGSISDRQMIAAGSQDAVIVHVPRLTQAARGAPRGGRGPATRQP